MTEWHELEVGRNAEIPGLPGVRIEALPVYHDPRGSLLELFRSDEIPANFKPLMACCSWSGPGVSRGPHQHAVQDDYFTFAGPSDFGVYLWDARPEGNGAARGWWFKTGRFAPSRVFVPHGVIHAYRNLGIEPGLVVTVTNSLYKGEGRREPVDEIRHELDPQSPYKLPPV